MTVCPTCHAHVGKNQKFCPSCGTRLEITLPDVAAVATRVRPRVTPIEKRVTKKRPAVKRKAR